MKIKQIHVSYSRTFNLGNYENVKIEAGLVADLDEGDNLQTAFEELRQEARLQVRAEYDRLEASRDGLLCVVFE